jgi:hypothetical protein
MNNTQISLAERKHFASLLADSLRTKEKRHFFDNSRILRDAFIAELVEEKGAAKIGEQIKATELKLQELNDQLSNLGFEFNRDEVRLASYSPLEKIVDDRIKKEIGTSEDVDARFDSAQLAMLTVATMADAEKLLRSVQTN